jgi:hypothetical protein
MLRAPARRDGKAYVLARAKAHLRKGGGGGV